MSKAWHHLLVSMTTVNQKWNLVDSSRGVHNTPGCDESSEPHIEQPDNYYDIIAAANNNEGCRNNNSNNIMERPLRKHTCSVENMVDISFANLREEDADILELGVEEKRKIDMADFDEEGRRLEASSHHRLSSASLTHLVEAVSLEGEGTYDYDVLTINNRCDNVDSNNQARSCDSGDGASPLRLSIQDEYSMPVIAEDSSITIPRPSSGPFETLELLREEGKQKGDADNDGDYSYFVEGSSSGSFSKDKVSADDVDVEALSLRISSGRCHRRSVSFDRRMNESAQFAEAVGEDPSLLLQKIIEEDSSSDFDDDDIDEEGVMLAEADEMLLEELIDFKASNEAVGSDVLRDGNVDHDVVPATLSEENNNVEPKCISTDLSRVPPNEQEVCYRLIVEDKQFSERKESDRESEEIQLLANSSASAPQTPVSSPAKARACPFTSFHPPYVDWKFTRQNSSSASLEVNRYQQTVAQNNSDTTDFRGIRLPEITQRGVARGNYAQLHRKAWLEVSDKHHRYGKNLRMYYKHWETLGHPYHMFFDWLDSKGEAKGSELPNLPEIPRSVLDSDTVQYITDPEISASYALDIVADPADGSAHVLDRRNQEPICTGKEGWIFVLRDQVFYGSQKVIAPSKVEAANNSSDDYNPATKPRQRFHHSSFFGGKAVASAGIFLTDEHGRLTHLYPHSGHYRPGEAHVQRVLFFMQQLGVELSTFVVDMQQLFKVSRKLAPKGGNIDAVDKENTSAHNIQGKHPTQQVKKAKKTDCLHLMCGLEVACFLAHKALMIERGVFHQIHKIRRIPTESRRVRNILKLCDVNNA